MWQFTTNYLELLGLFLIVLVTRVKCGAGNALTPRIQAVAATLATPTDQNLSWTVMMHNCGFLSPARISRINLCTVSCMKKTSQTFRHSKVEAF